MADSKPPAGKKPSAAPSASGFPVVEMIVLIVILVTVIPFVGALFSSAEDSGVLGFFAQIHSVLSTVATVVSMFAVAVAVYSYIRLSEVMAEETKKLGLQLDWNSERTQKNARWDRVELYMTSLNPSDWKIAILEADNILDEVVERMGYKGETLGERMKNIEASDFPYLEEAWTAHKTRNAIAHKGTDFVINRSDAEQTINIYNRIFKELGYL